MTTENPLDISQVEDPTQTEDVQEEAAPLQAEETPKSPLSTDADNAAQEMAFAGVEMPPIKVWLEDYQKMVDVPGELKNEDEIMKHLDEKVYPGLGAGQFGGVLADDKNPSKFDLPATAWGAMLGQFTFPFHVARSTGGLLKMFGETMPMGGQDYVDWMVMSKMVDEKQGDVLRKVLEYSPGVFNAYTQSRVLKKFIAERTDLDEGITILGEELVKATDVAMKFYGLQRPENKYAGFAYDVTSGVSSMLTALGMAYLTKNPLMVGTIFGATSTGGLYNDAREKGVAVDKASMFSLAGGVTEGALEGIGLEVFMNTLRGKKTLLRIFSRAFEEGGQEFFQELSTGGAAKSGGWSDDSWGDIRNKAFYAGMIGMIVGAPVSTMVTFAENAGILGDLRSQGMNDNEAKAVLEKAYKDLKVQGTLYVKQIFRDAISEVTKGTIELKGDFAAKLDAMEKEQSEAIISQWEENTKKKIAETEDPAAKAELEAELRAVQEVRAGRAQVVTAEEVEVAEEAQSEYARASSIQETESGDKVVAEKDGDAVVHSIPTAKFSLRNIPEWEENVRKSMTKMGATKEKIDAFVKASKEKLLYIRDTYTQEDSEDLMPEGVNKESKRMVRANKDPLYIWSIDATAMCVKRLHIMGYLSAIEDYAGRSVGLSVGEYLYVRQKLQAAGVTVPCIACYVESPRLQFNVNVNRFSQWVFDKLPKGEETDSMSMEAAQEVKNPEKRKKAVARVQKNLDAKRNLQKKYTAEDLDMQYFSDPEYASKQEDNPDSKYNRAKDLHDFIKKKASSASHANDPKAYEEYGGQLFTISDEDVNYLNKNAGLRFFSTSDFQVEHLGDLMQVVMDASIRGLKGHAYTKQIAFARIFAKTGMKINVSILSKLEKNENGEYEQDFDSADWEEAKALREEFPNIGVEIIGISDEQIEWAKKQEWIDYIIPFHRSGMAVEVREALGWDDYSSIQHEKQGKKDVSVSIGQLLDFKKGNTNAEIVERYLKHCEERGITPKFEKFLRDKNGKVDPNFAKLVKDFSRTDTPFEVLRPDFDLEAARDLTLEFINAGGQAQYKNIDWGLAKSIAKELKNKTPEEAEKLALQSLSDTQKKQYQKVKEFVQPKMSRKEASTDQTKTPEFKKWFGDSKVVDENGEPLVVYHGTTHDFNEFKTDRANIENHYGKAFYFTDSLVDADNNYAGEGPDLTQRISLRAERIFQDMFEGKDEPKWNSPAYKKAMEKASEIARKELSGDKQRRLDTYLSLKNPVILDGKNATRFEINYDEDTGEESGNGMDLYNAVIDVASEFGADGQEIWDDIMSKLEPTEFLAKEFEKSMRESEKVMYLEDQNDGSLASNEFIKEVWKAAGFDGIIMDADSEFGNKRAVGKKMAMDEGTQHYIVFNPTDIKSATDNRGTFDPENPDIRFSRSEKGNYDEAFQKWMDGNLPAGRNLFLGKNFKALVLAGADDVDVVVNKRVLDKAVEKHGISAEQLRSLPEYIADPIMIFQSMKFGDSIVVLTEMMKDDKSVVVAISLDKKIGSQLVVNDIASIHAKDSPESFGQWADAGGILYANKEKANRWLLTQPALIAGSIRQRLASDKNIALETEAVNAPEDVKPIEQEAPKKRGLDSKEVKTRIAEVAKAYAKSPQVVVVDRVEQLPDDLYAEVVIQNAKGDVEGVLHTDGKVYLVASNLDSMERAEFVYVHEVAGHFGLKGLFGNKLGKMMEEIYNGNDMVREFANKKMAEFGYDKALATEEALSDMANSIKEMSFWDKILTLVRRVLKKFGFGDRRFTNDEIAMILRDAGKYAKTKVSPLVIESRYSRKMKTLINRATGVDKNYKEVITNEVALLKAKYLAEARAAKKAEAVQSKMQERIKEAEAGERVAALRIEEQESETRAAEKQGKANAERSADMAVRQERNKLTAMFMKENIDAEEARSVLKDYIEANVPQDLKKNFRAMAARVKTLPQAFNAFRRIDDSVEKALKRDAIEGIKGFLEKLEKSQQVAIEYKPLLRGMVEDLNLVKPTKRKLERLKKTQEWIDRQRAEGKDVQLPQYVYDALKILDRKPAADLKLSELEDVLEKMNFVYDLGRTKLEARKAIRQAEMDRLRKMLAEAKTTKIEKRDLIKAKLGEKLTFGEKLKNAMTKLRNRNQLLGLLITPMDVFFDYIDGGQMYRGNFHKVFKLGNDINFSNYIFEKENIIDEIRALTEELGLEDVNFEKIGVYAALQQEDGLEKLINNGYSEEELSGLTLSAEEMRMYEFMREKLDGLRPRIEEMMRTVYNKELGDVKNYFPFLTDFELLDEVDAAKRLFEEREVQSGVQKKPELKFTKKRVGAGKQKIQVNALGVFVNHIDNALYALNVGPYNEMLSTIAQEDWVGEKIGERGQALLINWLETIAKKGGAAGQQRISGLDLLRRNVGAAVLGFKLSSFMIQPTALLDAGAMIGDYAFRGAGAITTSEDWRKFVLNSSEVRNRVGDDMAFNELAKNKTISKIQAAGLKPLQWLDSKTAASTWAGAYMKFMDENGMKVDFENPNTDAMNYADLILRRTQSSPLFKDAPLILSRGTLGEKFENKSLAKLFFQFQSFMLTRYSWIRHDMVRMGFGKGDWAKGLNMLMFLNFAIFSEMLIRGASAALVNGVLGADDDDEEEKNYVAQYFKEYLQMIPFVSQAVSAWWYGSIPVPAVSALEKIAKNLNYLSQSKDDDKVKKWLAISAIEGGGFGLGIPGTVQASQILKKLFD